MKGWVKRGEGREGKGKRGGGGKGREEGEAGLKAGLMGEEAGKGL